MPAGTAELATWMKSRLRKDLVLRENSSFQSLSFRRPATSPTEGTEEHRGEPSRHIRPRHSSKPVAVQTYRGAGFDKYSFDCAPLLSGVTLSGSMRTIR